MNGRFEVVLPAAAQESYLVVRVVSPGYLKLEDGLVVLNASTPNILLYQLSKEFPTAEEFEMEQRRWAAAKEQLETRKAEDLESLRVAEPKSLPKAAVKSVSVPQSVYVEHLVSGYNSSVCGNAGGYTGMIPFDEYLAGVVTRELGESFPQEALNAQAVAARSYSLERVNRGRPANCGQSYTSSYGTKSTLAAQTTSGTVMTYNGAVISALYSARCNGDNTLDSENGLFSGNCTQGGNYVAYLRSRPCSGHANCASYPREIPCLNCVINGSTVRIYGHGVGMCQRGAEGFANSGLTWQEILNGFYTSIVIEPPTTVALPTVDTRPALDADISTTSALIRGQVVNDGGAAISDWRFDWGIATPLANAVYSGSITVSGNDFYTALTGLSPDTTYFYRAWVRNSSTLVGSCTTQPGWGCGSILSFRTKPPTISVTVQSSPSDRSFTVDGTTYTTAQTFSWAPGSSHTIATTSPQAGASGVQYLWSSWSDGGTISHSVAPTSDTIYTASFSTEYYLTMNTGAGGSVSPASDWKNSRAVVSINATPSGGYSFSSWTGSGSGSYSGNSSSTTVTMNGPITETASFTVDPVNISVTVQPSPSGRSFTVDGTPYTTSQTFSWVSGSSHTVATSSPQSDGTGVQYAWSGWSDGGAMSHPVSPTNGTTYTANFTAQYRLDTGVSPAGSGTVVVNPPGTWFSPGQTLQLTASASSGFAFSSWVGVDSSSGGTASVTMNAYRSVTANFTAIAPVRAYTFITLAGSTNAGSQNGTGGAAQFNFETGVASDKAGNVYVADTYNSMIRKISPDGVVTTVAGLAGSPGSANGVGSAARFLWPNGVAVENGGTVYVADTYNSTIRKITPAGSVSTLAGAAGVAGFSDGLGDAARFNRPSGVAVDGNGVLYVADSGNNSIRRIAPGGLVGTLAGWTNAGYADGVGTNALLNGPGGVGVDGMGNVFVADTGNNTVRRIGTNGVVSTLAGLAGSAGRADGAGTNAQFNGLAAVAVDAAGNLYVADTYSYTIRRVASDGTVTTIAGAPGQYGYRNGAGTNALFGFASGIALDGSGNVYVADTDNNVIRKGWWSGTLPEVVLHSPKVSGGQVQLDFTLRTGPASLLIVK
ncbi:MAG: hypothetical protein HY674_08035 [Chloroflexi bacterium]|nr:hypothetical protein [Chloroflexota bacterium]